MKNISKQTMIEKFAKFSLNKIELNQVRGGEIPPNDDFPLPLPLPPKPKKSIESNRNWPF
jgi:hypothetical protein